MATCRLAAQAVVQSEVCAEIISAISATKVTQLNFGRFSTQTQGGQLVISPSGDVSATGGVVIASGSRHPATFIVTGEDQFTFSILLPTEPVTIFNASLAKGMTVTEWSSLPSEGTGNGLLVNGSQEVRVGAKLNIGSMEDNPSGLYQGIFTVKFNYN